MSTTNGMHGFWSATPSESSASKKAFYIRMQISLTQEEYAKQRTPFFVRFLTKAGKMVHLPIDTYRYVRPHSLETRFYFDEPDAFPVQTPVVCFDPDDDGDDDDEALRPLDLYIRLSAKAARLRDKLETHFPECRQVDVGFMENELMLFLRLRGNFMVAVSSDGSVPIFTWDRRCLIPMDRAEPKLGQGFKLTMPSAGGKAEHFWYERERVQLFASVRKVVQYADAHVYKGTSELRVDPARHLRSVDIVRSSPALRTNLRRLDRTMPYIKVATYSRVEHSIKVYADVHWRCEVTLHINGTWRVVCLEPDPVVGSCNGDYLELVEAGVHRALTRVCAGCRRSEGKMRACPCREVHYCSEECQRAHWKEHRVGCCTRKGE